MSLYITNVFSGLRRYIRALNYIVFLSSNLLNNIRRRFEVRPADIKAFEK